MLNVKQQLKIAIVNKIKIILFNVKLLVLHNKTIKITQEEEYIIKEIEFIEFYKYYKNSL